MVKVVVDSSVLIEEERKGSKLYWKMVKKAKEGKIKILIPTVVIAELWMDRSMDKKTVFEGMEKRISPFERVSVDEEVARKAGEIGRKGEVWGFDAVIAASCLVNRASLITLNKKHFSKIKGLKFYEAL